MVNIAFIFKRTGLALVGAGLLTLVGCGGGGGDAPPASFTGAVATGAAMEGALIHITDGAGDNACSNATGTPLAVTADAGGKYHCTLIAAAAAPFAIVATDPTGVRAPLVAMAASRPASGQTATVNISQMTTAVLTMLTPNNEVLSLIPQLGDSPAQKAQRVLNLISARDGLASQTTALVNQLAPALVALGLNPATYNPFSTAFVPSNTAGTAGDAADKLLDAVKVDFSTAVPTLATLFSSPISLASPASSTNQPISATGLTGAGAVSAAELDFVRTMLQACLNLPADSRVPLGTSPTSWGGRNVVVLNKPVAAACQGIVVDDASVGLHFKQFGQPAALWFHKIMTDPAMDGAKVNVVDVLRVFPGEGPAGQDLAVVNIRWVDNTGVPGGMMLEAIKLPGSRPSGTQWWLYGNQSPVNAFVQPVQARIEQLADVSQPGFNADSNTMSSFASGMRFYVEKDDSATTKRNVFTVGLTAARVKGPGLPAAGLVLVNPSLGNSENTMSIERKDGDVSSPASSDGGNFYGLQTTAGLTGANATTLKPLNDAGFNFSTNSNSGHYVRFVHPSDFGLTPDANYVFSVASMPVWSTYTYELFYNNSTTPTHTFKSRLMAPVVGALQLASRTWARLDAPTLGSLDPANPSAAGPLSSLTLAWNNDPLAPRVSYANAFSYGSTPDRRAARSAFVPKGQYSATATSPAGFPLGPLTSTGSSGRNFQLRFLRADGTYQTSFTRYN